MLPRRQIWIVSALTVVLSLTQANLMNAPVQGRQLDALDALDDLLKGKSDTQSPSTAAGTTTDISSSTTQDPSTTPSPSPSPTPNPSTSGSTTSTTSSSSTTLPHTSSTQTSATVHTTSSPSQTATQSHVTEQVVITTDGNVSTLTSTSPSSSATNAASLSGTSSSSTGLSSKTKSTVIGVVVGVGGAIILAGLLIVAWRIWGRKKSEDENDGLMGYRVGSSGKQEKSGSSNGPTTNPFQSTLENYHNPARVNASSNF